MNYDICTSDKLPLSDATEKITHHRNFLFQNYLNENNKVV